MKIRAKILFVVLPLLTVAVVMVGVVSYMLAAASVNHLAVEFFDFMAEEITNYAVGQWNLLVENNEAGNPVMENAAKQAVENFSRSILRSDTQAVFALDKTGAVAMQVGPAGPSEQEREALASYVSTESRKFITIRVGNMTRAAYTIPFGPFAWRIIDIDPAPFRKTVRRQIIREDL